MKLTEGGGGGGGRGGGEQSNILPLKALKRKHVSALEATQDTEMNVPPRCCQCVTVWLVNPGWLLLGFL